ncbi:lipopolysaccharide assembly outer membrane protein LptD (OstA) [Pedobacter sp. UYP30]|uniref:putative LPS assembly protein LptD n=1 Tax=Pedobacter sp. UYP30 TaxID=1756400 RepID=UPI003397DA20
MKILANSIFVFTVILLVFTTNRVNATLYISLQQITQLDTAKKDSSRNDTTRGNAKNKSELDKKVEYKAEDSTKFSKDKSIIYLYGQAKVLYGDFELSADYIRYDSKNDLIFARGRIDPKTKKYVGRPIFKSGAEGSALADSIYYNSKTSKAKVFGVFSEQEGGYFSGGQTKKQIDDEVHLKNVLYSTCDLPFPHQHFGFVISKGIVTQKQIVTGPVYLEVEGVPLPIGLPFAFFPKPNKRTSGVILPQPGEDATRGFYLQNGGYYLGLNDYWDAKILGSIYTNGSYETSLLSNYTKRYKYNGNVSLRYASVKNGLEGTKAFETPNKDFSIGWSHSQNANAHPGTNFSASVNLVSSTYYTSTAANSTYDINAIARNTTSSSISYAKNFNNGMNYSLSFGSDQTLSTKDISVRLPTATFNVPTFNPFDSKTRVGEQKWYQKISVGYGVQANNSITTKDTLLFQNDGLKRLKSGFSHNIPISASFTALKYLNFSVGGSYNEVWNFQTTRNKYTTFGDGTYSIRTDTVSGFKRAGSYSFSTSMSTKVYGITKKFKNLGNIEQLRHVMTPNVSFSYSPDFTKAGSGPFLAAIDQNGKPIINSYDQRPLTYSIFENSAYPGSFSQKSASIGFGLDNTVELKVRDRKDTTGTGEKKIPIIQGLSLSGSYNFVAPRNKLSNLSFSGRSQFNDKLGINYNGSFDPYTLDAITDPATGVTTYSKSNVLTFKNGKLPRLTSIGFSFDYSLNPAALKKKNEANDALKDASEKGITPIQSEQLSALSRDPNAFVDFNIPWNFSFSYSFQYANDFGRSSTSNTLNFNGDVNFTPKWKATFSSGYDFKNNGLTPMQLGIYRDLHCWDMSINWVPYGAYKSYSVTLRVKSAILQDLKLSKRQGYYNSYN